MNLRFSGEFNVPPPQTTLYESRSISDFDPAEGNVMYNKKTQKKTLLSFSFVYAIVLYQKSIQALYQEYGEKSCYHCC